MTAAARQAVLDLLTTHPAPTPGQVEAALDRYAAAVAGDAPPAPECEFGPVETTGVYIGERACRTHGGHSTAKRYCPRAQVLAAHPVGEGWVALGTHMDCPVRLEFCDHDGGGVPAHERVLAGGADAVAAHGEFVEVFRGWVTHDDGSESPIERWVRGSDDRWISLDNERVTRRDIRLDPAALGADR